MPFLQDKFDIINQRFENFEKENSDDHDQIFRKFEQNKEEHDRMFVRLGKLEKDHEKMNFKLAVIKDHEKRTKKLERITSD